MQDGGIPGHHDDLDSDSLFGSPPPSPGRGRSPSPLALPGGQNSVQNVGTLALPGSHLCSELPPVPPPASAVCNAARRRSQPLINAPSAVLPRSSTVPPSSGAILARPVPLQKKKRPSRRSTPASEARPTPPPIELPSPTDPPPANFLRNQQGLLGHAGLVSGVNPANLSLQRHMRGRTANNPIVVEDEDDQPSIGRRPLQNQSGVPTSRLPIPSSEEIVSNLVKQKNLIPVMDALVRLVAGSAVPPTAAALPPNTSNIPSTSSSSSAQAQPYHTYPYYPYPYAYPYYYYPYGYTYPYAASAYQHPPAPSSSSGPPPKKRKLTDVPAGAADWDVPYPFPEGQGPPDYHQNWQRQRGQQLVEDLVGLVKSAAKKAAVQKACGEASAKDGLTIGSVEYYRERVLRNFRHPHYEVHPAAHTTTAPVASTSQPVRSVAHNPSLVDHDPDIAILDGPPLPVSGPITETSPPSLSDVAVPAKLAGDATHPFTAAVEEPINAENEVDAAQSTCSTVASIVTDPPETASEKGELLQDETQNNIDDLLSIFNDWPIGDLDALLNSTDFSSIDPDDFDFSAFDMTGVETSSSSVAGSSLAATAVLAASTGNAKPDCDPEAMPGSSTFAIDPELLALPHPELPPPAVSSMPDQPVQPDKFSVRMMVTTAGTDSGAPPTPTLVGSPLSQVDFDPPTPEWNIQFPEPEIASTGSEGTPEREGDDRSNPGALAAREDLRRYVLMKALYSTDGTPGESLPKRHDKGKGRAVDVEMEAERAGLPMDIDRFPSIASETPPPPPVQASIIPAALQPAATWPTRQPTATPPPPPPNPLDMLEPLRKTLAVLLPSAPPRQSHVSSLLVTPPAVLPLRPSGPSTQVKDREDILRRARLMRAQLTKEIERAKVELWETTMEGGCLTVLLKERDKMLASNK
jgi:hypothetical protein